MIINQPTINPITKGEFLILGNFIKNVCYSKKNLYPDLAWEIEMWIKSIVSRIKTSIYIDVLPKKWLLAKLKQYIFLVKFYHNFSTASFCFYMLFVFYSLKP